jgi:tetratricopeptide (TPR) repeat protein
MEIEYYSFAVAGYAIPSEPSGTFTATRMKYVPKTRLIALCILWVFVTSGTAAAQRDKVLDDLLDSAAIAKSDHQPEQSARLFEQALTRTEQVGDAFSQRLIITSELAKVYVILADQARNAHQYADEQTCLQRVLALYATSPKPNPVNIQAARRSLEFSYYNSKEYNQSNQVLDKMLASLPEIPEHSRLKQRDLWYAKWLDLRALGKVDEAEPYLQLVADDYRRDKTASKERVGDILICLGEDKITHHQYDAARKIFEEALQCYHACHQTKAELTTRASLRALPQN